MAGRPRFQVSMNTAHRKLHFSHTQTQMHKDRGAKNGQIIRAPKQGARRLMQQRALASIATRDRPPFPNIYCIGKPSPDTITTQRPKAHLVQ